MASIFRPSGAEGTAGQAQGRIGCTIPKSRFISFSPGNPGVEAAIRVRLDSLHHPDPPYAIGSSAAFSAFEGQWRWVGPPVEYVESTSNPVSFYASKLECTPDFRDWSTVGLLHVTGPAMVPDSSYSVQMVRREDFESCPDENEGMFTENLEVLTGRWGDIIPGFHTPGGVGQPDFTDVGSLIDKFRSQVGAPIKAQSLLAGNAAGDINLAPDLGFNHIAACVDAFRGYGYPFSGPTSCGCDVNIRVDSNNDGYIDCADDDPGLPAMIVYVNDDDDDFDGFNDNDPLQPLPVNGENDLIEVRLPQDCHPSVPAATTWSVSWPLGPPSPINIWLAPDKALPTSGPLANTVPTAWPPPASVWIEAISPMEGFNFSFAFTDDGTGSLASDDKIIQTQMMTKIKLRVVAVVEPGASLIAPFQVTGGSKLTKVQMAELVQQLVDFAPRMAPGLQFVWNGNAPDAILKLESECMKLLPFPFEPNLSICQALGFPEGNPRRAEPAWLRAEVARGDEHTDAHLKCAPYAGTDHWPADGMRDVDEECYDIIHQDCPSANLFCNGFDSSRCTINIYFVGSMESDQTPGLPLYGKTWEPDVVYEDWVQDAFHWHVAITDGAFFDGTDAPNFLRLKSGRVLEHEVGCHYLARQGLHRENLTNPATCSNDPISGPGMCQNDLCLSGPQMEGCLLNNPFLDFDLIHCYHREHA